MKGEIMDNKKTNGSETVRKDTTEDLCITRKYYDMPCKTCILNNLPQCPEYKKQEDTKNIQPECKKAT